MALPACGFVHDEKIVGHYHLVAVDIDAEMSVCYELNTGSCIGRIPGTVFAVGADAHYIVAKQHPGNDRTVVQYFILQMDKDNELSSPEASVVGPLSEAQYNQQARALRLPPFSRAIASLK